MPIAADATVAASARVAEDATVWGLAQVREDAEVGPNSIVGRGAYIDVGVIVGANCKIQNDALLYAPARLADGVFVGPAVVLTNDRHPRAVNPDGSLKSASDWVPVGVDVGEGASLGARSVCVAPLRVGRWATVAAGAVVTHDVPDHALVAGVPARIVGWVGHAGHPLRPRGPLWECPVTGRLYQEASAGLAELLADSR